MIQLELREELFHCLEITISNFAFRMYILGIVSVYLTVVDAYLPPKCLYEIQCNRKTLFEFLMLCNYKVKSALVRYLIKSRTCSPRLSNTSHPKQQNRETICTAH